MASEHSSPGPVLIVEDHADTREMVQLFLEWHGTPVKTARNGEEGLAALHEHRPSLILLDLTMPVMDGWQFRAKQLALQDPELVNAPVVILSALSDCERQGQKLGAAAVMPKPIDFDRLLELVATYRTPECVAVAAL